MFGICVMPFRAASKVAVRPGHHVLTRTPFSLSASSGLSARGTELAVLNDSSEERGIQ